MTKKKKTPFRAKAGTDLQRMARNRNFAIFRLKNALGLVEELSHVEGLDTIKAREGLADLLQDVKTWETK